MMLLPRDMIRREKWATYSDRILVLFSSWVSNESSKEVKMSRLVDAFLFFSAPCAFSGADIAAAADNPSWDLSFVF